MRTSCVPLVETAGDVLHGDALDARARRRARRRVLRPAPGAAPPGRPRRRLAGVRSNGREARHRSAGKLLQGVQQVLVLALAAALGPADDLLVLGPGGIGGVLEEVRAEHLVDARFRGAELRLVLAEPRPEQRHDRLVVDGGVVFALPKPRKRNPDCFSHAICSSAIASGRRRGVLERPDVVQAARDRRRGGTVRNFQTMPGPPSWMASNRNRPVTERGTSRPLPSGYASTSPPPLCADRMTAPGDGSSCPARGWRGRARAPRRCTCRGRTSSGRPRNGSSFPAAGWRSSGARSPRSAARSAPPRRPRDRPYRSDPAAPARREAVQMEEHLNGLRVRRKVVGDQDDRPARCSRRRRIRASSSTPRPHVARLRIVDRLAGVVLPRDLRILAAAPDLCPRVSPSIGIRLTPLPPALPGTSFGPAFHDFGSTAVQPTWRASVVRVMQRLDRAVAGESLEREQPGERRAVGPGGGRRALGGRRRFALARHGLTLDRIGRPPPARWGTRSGKSHGGHPIVRGAGRMVGWIAWPSDDQRRSPSSSPRSRAAGDRARTRPSRLLRPLRTRRSATR